MSPDLKKNHVCVCVLKKIFISLVRKVLFEIIDKIIIRVK